MGSGPIRVRVRFNFNDSGGEVRRTLWQDGVLPWEFVINVVVEGRQRRQGCTEGVVRVGIRAERGQG